MSKIITIDIVSDTVCPWCFIGKRRLERALSEMPQDMRVMIGWRPFQLNPEMPEGGLDRKTYLESKFGGPDGAKQAYDTITASGAEEGIAFNFTGIGRTPNTINSHRLIQRAAVDDKQDEVVEALFKAYFLDGRDIGDVDVLVEVAEAAGMDGKKTRAYLETDEDADQVRQEDAMARNMGVSGVPCFILNRKYAISGAQAPEVFKQAFAQVLQEMEAEGIDAPEHAGHDHDHDHNQNHDHSHDHDHGPGHKH
jgi:predicted DsbA family dithiol-disulfide isomerase